MESEEQKKEITVLIIETIDEVGDVMYTCTESLDKLLVGLECQQ